MKNSAIPDKEPLDASILAFVTRAFAIGKAVRLPSDITSEDLLKFILNKGG